MTQRSEVNTVFLDTLDGYEFEELCARIYRQLGYRVENIQSTGDEGRDLILNSPEGDTIVIECKHWAKGTVGRPVVQKLHSAMLTYPAKRGAVITTGSFAKQALAYIGKVSEDIQLIDLPKLRALAAKAGINLATDRKSAPLMAYPTGSNEVIKGRLNRSFINKLISSPTPAADLFDITNRDVDWNPAYLIRYSVNQDFSTSVGLIHREKAANAALLVDAKDGTLFQRRVTDLLKSTRASEISSGLQSGKPMDLPPFVLGATEIKARAKDHIRHLHTTVVSYHGRNNQTYERECVPANKYISLNDVAQVYIPIQGVRLTALKTRYKLRFIEGDRDLLCSSPPDIKCQYCGQEASETPPGPFLSSLSQSLRAQICNTCGAITHVAAWFMPHSFRCASCRKTICRNCAYWVPKLALFKRILCDGCAELLPAGVARRLPK